MASVHLKFEPPDSTGLTTLIIFESSEKEGVYSEIERVTDVGTFPNYLDEYTTNKATAVEYWFAIQWEDSKGATTEVSAPVQGNSSTPVGDIVSRVELRDPSLTHAIVVQEAEAALERVLPPGTDVYDPSISLTYRQLRGLTNLTLAMCYMVSMAQTATGDFTAGLVAMKSSDTAIKSRVDSIQRLVKSANSDLGLSFSMIAYLQELDIPGTLISNASQFDQSRLIYELR